MPQMFRIVRNAEPKPFRAYQTNRQSWGQPKSGRNDSQQAHVKKIRNDNRTEIVDLLKMSFVWRYSDTIYTHNMGRTNSQNGLMCERAIVCARVCVCTGCEKCKVKIKNLLKWQIPNG